MSNMLRFFWDTQYGWQFDSYAKDGGPEVVRLACSFYQGPSQP